MEARWSRHRASAISPLFLICLSGRPDRCTARFLMQSSPRLGLLLGFIGAAMFAGSLPATRLAVGAFSPLFVASSRTLLAGCAGLLLIVVMRRSLPPKRLWGILVVSALGNAVGFPLLSAIGMHSVPASHGGVVIGLLPLATAVCAAIAAKERPSPGFWIAAVAGAALVSAYALRQDQGTTTLGDAALLGAVASAAIGYTAAATAARAMQGWEVSSWSVILLLPFYSVATVVFWPDGALTAPQSAWAGILYGGFGAQWIAFFAWNAGLSLGGIARVAQVQLLQPFMTVLIAAQFNGEPISAETILFAVAVVAVVLIGQRMRVPRRSVIEKA